MINRRNQHVYSPATVYAAGFDFVYDLAGKTSVGRRKRSYYRKRFIVMFGTVFESDESSDVCVPPFGEAASFRRTGIDNQGCDQEDVLAA